MNTGSAVDSLKHTYTYGKAWKSTFRRFLLALIGTFERHRSALFACATAHLGEDQEQQIRLRAIAQIAKLSRELEKNERARTDLYNAGVMQTKTEQLDDAGLKTLFLRG